MRIGSRLVEFLKPTLITHFTQLAADLRALPRFCGELAVGAWASDSGLAVGYLCWNLQDDPLADTVDLVLAVSLRSRGSKKAVVTLDLAWSDGWLIAQFLDQSLAVDSPEVLSEQIDALVSSRRAEVVALMSRALDGDL
jgi:hypothetical protein